MERSAGQKQPPAWPLLSVIIPAYNESAIIADVLGRLHQLLAGRYRYEIIVVDHGSTDATVAVAEANGATVYTYRGATVAGLRNYGARHAAGDVLLFLDADVVPTTGWIEGLPGALEALAARPRVLTGSTCGIPRDAGLIERFWFDPALYRRGLTHLGSAHMLITRAFFEELGGFEETLETGEDYDLCTRAREHGGTVVDDPRLPVEHRGNPQTLYAFVRREIWHGSGDFRSLRSVWRSKVALATLGFVGLHVVLVIALAARDWLMLGLAAGLIVLLCAAAALTRFSARRPSVLLFNTALFYFYFLGRAGSILRALWLRFGQRRGWKPRSRSHGPAAPRGLEAGHARAEAALSGDRPGPRAD